MQHHGKKNVLYDLGFENLGCRAPEKYSKYFGTTAGILCAIRPCGIIADWTEMLRAESVTLWIHLIGWMFEKVGQEHWPRGIMGDIICDLVPKLRKMLAEGEVPDEWVPLFKYVEWWALDVFHGNKHTEGACFLFSISQRREICLCSAPCLPVGSSEYNIMSDKFEGTIIRALNSQICEQCFAHYKKIAVTANKTNRVRYNWFLHMLQQNHNYFQELRLQNDPLLKKLKKKANQREQVREHRS